MISRNSKSYLKNIIRHTDAHNKVIEEDDMWKTRDSESRRRRRSRSPKSAIWTMGKSRDRVRGLKSRVDPVPRTYMDRMPSPLRDKKLVSEGAGSKWGHSGFAELYPEDVPERMEVKNDLETNEPDSMNEHTKKKERHRSSPGLMPPRSFSPPQRKKNLPPPPNQAVRNPRIDWDQRIKTAFKDVPIREHDSEDEDVDSKRMKSKIVIKDGENLTEKMKNDNKDDDGRSKDRKHRQRNNSLGDDKDTKSKSIRSSGHDGKDKDKISDRRKDDSKENRRDISDISRRISDENHRSQNSELNKDNKQSNLANKSDDRRPRYDRNSRRSNSRNRCVRNTDTSVDKRLRSTSPLARKTNRLKRSRSNDRKHQLGESTNHSADNSRNRIIARSRTPPRRGRRSSPFSRSGGMRHRSRSPVRREKVRPIDSSSRRENDNKKSLKIGSKPTSLGVCAKGIAALEDDEVSESEEEERTKHSELGPPASHSPTEHIPRSPSGSPTPQPLATSNTAPEENTRDIISSKSDDKINNMESDGSPSRKQNSVESDKNRTLEETVETRKIRSPSPKRRKHGKSSKHSRRDKHKDKTDETNHRNTSDVATNESKLLHLFPILTKPVKRSGSLSEGEILDTDEESQVPIADIPMPNVGKVKTRQTTESVKDKETLIKDVEGEVELATEKLVTDLKFPSENKPLDDSSVKVHRSSKSHKDSEKPASEADESKKTVETGDKKNSASRQKSEKSDETRSSKHDSVTSKAELTFTGFKISGKAKNVKIERKYQDESEEENEIEKNSVQKLEMLKANLEKELLKTETVAVDDGELDNKDSEKLKTPETASEKTSAGSKHIDKSSEKHEKSSRRIEKKNDETLEKKTEKSSENVAAVAKPHHKHFDKTDKSKTSVVRDSSKPPVGGKQKHAKSSSKTVKEKVKVDSKRRVVKSRKRKASTSSSSSSSSSESSSSDSSDSSDSSSSTRRKVAGKKGVVKKKRGRSSSTSSSSSSSSTSSSSRSPSPTKKKLKRKK